MSRHREESDDASAALEVLIYTSDHVDGIDPLLVGDAEIDTLVHSPRVR